MASFTELFGELADRYGKDIAEAFQRAVADLRRNADLQRLIAALEADDLEAALEAVNIDPAAFNEVQDRVEEAYREAGRTTAESFPRRHPDGTALSVRFDGRNPVAENWLREHSSRLVTRITEDQRLAVRQMLRAGMEAGVNPRTTALRLVGTVNRATGAREGGILGLTSQQEAHVRAARAELASGDPEALRNYLTRARRNKLFDRSVLKAIRDGKPVPAETAGKAVTAYTSGLLRLRGEMIGSLETFDALAEAKNEAYRQAIASGQIRADQVTKGWRHFQNENPRVQHIAMSGKWVAFDEDFVMPDGTRMRFAHDPQAPIKHKAGCHCQTDYRINFLSNIRRRAA